MNKRFLCKARVISVEGAMKFALLYGTVEGLAQIGGDFENPESKVFTFSGCLTAAEVKGLNIMPIFSHFGTLKTSGEVTMGLDLTFERIVVNKNIELLIAGAYDPNFDEITGSISGKTCGLFTGLIDKIVIEFAGVCLGETA